MHLLAAEGKTVTLHHEGHTFVVPIEKYYHPPKPDGTVDTEVLVTPQLTCIDPGCEFTCHSAFPLFGDPHAQHIHVLHRAVTKHQGDVSRAARVVAQEIREQRGHLFFDPMKLTRYDGEPLAPARKIG